jgi:membrane protein DedA with SNARE-associated domain/rhodanese-related sulfurtransferase
MKTGVPAMALPTHVLLTYGYLLLFAWVLVEQLGLPLPAMPIVLAAGALSAEGQLSFALALAAGLSALLVADSILFLIGRRYGPRVLRLVCHLSLEPTTCVRRAQESLGRRHGVTLIFAKFVPGLALLAAPAAGQIRMDYRSFLSYDFVGAILWMGGLLAVGRFFGDALNHSAALLGWAGRFSGGLLILGVAGFLVARVVRRRKVLKELAAARVEPEELKRLLDAGEEIFIVDLRHPLELIPDPYTLPGARHISPAALASRYHEIPRDREIVLFCTCPSEATAAKTAMTLRKLGIERVHPLRGGLEAWRKLGFPMEALAPERAAGD